MGWAHRVGVLGGGRKWNEVWIRDLDGELKR